MELVPYSFCLTVLYRKEHEKCINEKELTIASMEESIASLRTELEHTMKQDEFKVFISNFFP